jgi:chloride channel protein, CIC family
MSSKSIPSKSSIFSGLRSTAGRWILLGILVGVVSGLGASAFFYALEWVTHTAFDTLAHAPMASPAGEEIFAPGPPAEKNNWLFFILPVIGGLISGILVYTFAPEAEGHGTDAMIDAFHNKRGVIRSRVPFVKSLATIATLGLGGSAGREGPIAQIGAGFGSWIATKFGLSARDRRIMLLAGTAGGLGAIFRSPLGGAITAIEVLYSEDFESEALIPSIISSVTAYAIFASIFGYDKIFAIPPLAWRGTQELAIYVMLGLICVPVGVFYIRAFYGMRDKVFRKLRKLPRFLLPAIGGLGVGILGLVIPEAYGSGWGTIQLALFGKLTIWMMLLIMLAKIAATSLTIGSGGSGGVFGPTLFIGGMLGGVVGQTAELMFPEVVSHTGGYVLVGMAAFFAGVANAPIGALLMVCEMTGGYDLLVPLMLVSVVAILFTRKWSIYERQVKDKFQSPAHLGDLTIDILEEMTVADAYQPDDSINPLPEGMRFGDFRRLVAGTSLSHFPVADRHGRLCGLVSLKATRPGIFEEGLDELVIISDIASPLVTVYPEDNLHEALQKLLKHSYTQVPVIEESDPNHIVGYLRHEDLIHAYHQEILRRKGPDGND